MASQNATVYVSNLPVGSIILWHGSSDSVPQNWKICDGTNDTPNLTGRFVVGAGGATYAKDSKGGNSQVTLTENQMPSHSHGITDPGHSHEYHDKYSPESGDEVNTGSQRKVDWLVDEQRTTKNADTGISINHTGGSESINIMPPYYALYYIMKTS